MSAPAAGTPTENNLRRALAATVTAIDAVRAENKALADALWDLYACPDPKHPSFHERMKNAADVLRLAGRL